MKSTNVIIIMMIIALFGLAIWAWMYLQTSSQTLLIEMGKTGASLALLTVIGGLVQWLIKLKERSDKISSETIGFYRGLLEDFKTVYDKVERARLLIEAHRSAKTYEEQMRELIDGVVILHNAKRALNPEFPELEKELKPIINQMILFIKNLLKEFRDNYQPIAVLQAIDEARKKELISANIQEPNSDISRREIPSASWQKIMTLPNLSELRDDENYHLYEKGFLIYLDKASLILRNRIPAKE